ncbi:MAG: acetoin utilization protein AcuC [Gammaproteobacteria bacterium]|nr:acetoin utilization protein AcuC [Gammaproteobacteria bacterium]
MLLYAGNSLARYGFGQGHPFGPDRYQVFWNAICQQGLEQRCEIAAPVDGCAEQVLLFHTPDYLSRVKALSVEGTGMLDPDTPVFPGIYQAALTVVGSVIDAVDRLVTDTHSSAFIPIAGLHHARRDGSAGFCVFNDCGIAVEHLRKRHRVRRIAYVDIDAHHGDGLFYAFEGDPEVTVVDLHEDGRYLYPGTGHAFETGSGAAAGTKLNIPLPPGATDAVFFQCWEHARSFVAQSDPEFVILQCGADSIAGDPITSLALSEQAHFRAARDLAEIVRNGCARGLLALGGGGYNRDNIARGWSAVVRALIEAETPEG